MALAVLFVLYHQSGRRETRAMEAAAETGLRRFYDAFAGRKLGETNGVFQPGDLMDAGRQELNAPRFFPSFVTASNFLVSTVGAARGTTNLLCVVQPWSDAKYGIDARGQTRKVSETEFQNWPHSAVRPQ